MVLDDNFDIEEHLNKELSAALIKIFPGYDIDRE